MIKVLIVDDEYIMRQGLKYMISWEEEGYEILGEATNGEEALRSLKEEQPDIIISDIVMPVLDGADFTEVVHRLYPQIRIIILSGYDKFEYVKSTFQNGVTDYILKPTLTPDILRQVLSKASEGLTVNEKPAQKNAGLERSLGKYLQGMTDKIDKELIKKELPMSLFTLYGVDISRKDRKTPDLSDVLFSGIKKGIAESSSNPDGIKTLVLMYREEAALVIFNHEHHHTTKVRELAGSINDRLLAMDDVFGVISRSFTDITRLREISRNDIFRNLEKSFYFPSEKLLEAESLSDKTLPRNERFDFFKFNTLLADRNFLEAIGELKAYNEKALEYMTDPYALKNQIKNMIYHLLDYMDLDPIEGEDKRYGYFKAIDDSKDVKSYRKAMEEIFNGLEGLTGNSIPGSDENMERITAYIKDNYREDLKLEDLADKFGFNYHYLSSYFSTHMKEGFSDYLNRYRIKQAAKLLKETGEPISSVGQTVGYSDHSYFCRVFKKITGKTPSEYRRENFV